MKLKLWLKRYGIISLICVGLFAFFVKELNSYLQNAQKGIELELNWRATCLQDTNSSSEIMELCRQAQQEPIPKFDYISIFSNVVIYKMKFLTYLAVFLVLVPVTYFATKEYKNRVSLYYLIRQSYPKYLQKVIFQSNKYVLFFPLLFLIIFFVCAILSKGFALDISLIINDNWSIERLSNPYLFIFLYILNLIFHLGLYANIGLCVARKNHSFFLAVLLSFLTIMGLEIFLEVGIHAILFSKVLDSSFGYLFNILNWLIFPDDFGIPVTVLMSFMFYLLSCIIVYLCYKDKEKFIVDLEKNN